MDERHELRMGADDFLAWAEEQDGKHELVDGTVVMQAGASRDHERVAKLVFKSLLDQVDDREFDVNKGDFGVRLKEGDREGSVLLPDVLVDPQSELGSERATTTPIVVIEVLSPSIDLAYHVAKLAKYATLPSLMHYAVFHQTEPVVHVWFKGEAGWPEAPLLLQGLDAALSLPSVGAVIRLADVYRRPERKGRSASG